MSIQFITGFSNQFIRYACFNYSFALTYFLQKYSLYMKKYANSKCFNNVFLTYTMFARIYNRIHRNMGRVMIYETSKCFTQHIYLAETKVVRK